MSSFSIRKKNLRHITLLTLLLLIVFYYWFFNLYQSQNEVIVAVKNFQSSNGGISAQFNKKSSSRENKFLNNGKAKNDMFGRSSFDERLKEKNEDVGELKQKQQKDNNIKEKDCIIGVVAANSDLEKLAKAAFTTWIKDMLPFCDVIIFVGSITDLVVQSENEEIFKHHLVKLNVSDTYPPLKKVFGLWEYFYKKFILNREKSQYKWFVKVDVDTYVNPWLFSEIIKTLQSSLQSNRPIYIGKKASGRISERDKLGITRPYCVGLGMILNVISVRKVGEKAAQCMEKRFTEHSDTEIGRCVNVDCQNGVSSLSFLQLHNTIDENGDLNKRKLWSNKQMYLGFPKYPMNYLFKNTIIHSIKQAAYFVRFHYQVKLKLRPVLPYPNCEFTAELNGKSVDKVCKTAVKQFKQSCVNNPSIQLEENFKYLPECKFEDLEDFDPKVDLNFPAFVVGVTTEESYQTFLKVKSNMKITGFTDIRRIVATKSGIKYSVGNSEASALAPSVVGYRDAILEVLLKAKVKKIKRIAVFDENVIFRCDFASMYFNTMKEKRCGNCFWLEKMGGVFSLGSNINVTGNYPKWHSTAMSGWNMAKADMKNATNKAKNTTKETQCFNVNSKTFGAHAVLLHENVYDAIITWLKSSEHANEPFDYVFNFLAKEGHLVRAANPSLVKHKLDSFNFVQTKSNELYCE